MTWFDLIIGFVAIAAAGVAALTGFGIGSILTPLLSFQLGTKIAVALVSIPHFVATLLRFWMLRAHIDRKVLWQFGLTSVAGGLIGALLHHVLGGPVLTVIFAMLLIFAAGMDLSGWSNKMRFGKRTAWFAGALSGALGGLVGNQGGIRSAAILGFQLSKQSFVATATAIGVLVDLARMPVYFWTQSQSLIDSRRVIIILTSGAIVGTIVGTRFLRKVPEKAFRRIVSLALLGLGGFMLYQGLSAR